MIYTVTFAPALDYALWLDRMIPGEVNRAQRTRLFVGGKGINGSLVLRELGIPSVCLGFAAGFTGSEIVRRLRQEGLNEQMVRLENGLSRINVKLKGAEETEINASGPAVDEAAMHAFLRRLEALGPGDVLVLSGGVPQGAEETLYARLNRMAAAKGAETVVDATGAQLIHALAEGPMLVKPNLRELEAATGGPIRTLATLAERAEGLRRQGARNVLVSLGAEGALLACDSGVYRCAAPKGTVLGTTGAGDTMVAAYLYAARLGLEDARRLRLCVAAGSATAFSEVLAAKDTVEAILRRTPMPERVSVKNKF